MNCLKEKKTVIISGIIAVALGVALSMDMGIPDLHLVATVERQTLMGMPEIVWNLYGSVNWLTAIVLALLLFFVFLWLNESNFWEKNVSIGVVATSVFLALMFWVAQGFVINDEMTILVQSTAQIFKSIIFIIGYSLLFIVTFSLLDSFINKIIPKLDKKEETSKHTFWFILLAWLPHLLISFPGTVAGDTLQELWCWNGLIPWDKRHPIFHILYTGIVLDVGKIINTDVAIFLYCLIQTIIFAAILSYMMRLIVRLKAPTILYNLILFICMTCPYYTNYITSIVKDGLYSYCVLLFMIELIYYLLDGKAFWYNKKHLILWTLSIMGALLYRINGKYLIYPCIMVLVIRSIVDKTTIKEKSRNIAFLVLPAFLAFIVYGMILVAYDVEEMPAEDSMSLALQQTARYVKYHGDEVTLEERNAINGILDYDSLADAYDPRVSDPVKLLVKSNDSDKIKAYFSAWMSMGKKHPGTYIAAILDQNYYIFYTGVPNNIVTVGLDGQAGFGSEEDAMKKVNYAKSNGLYLRDISVLNVPRKLLFILYQAYFFCPVLGLLAHPAFYDILFLILLVFSFRRKYWGWVVAGIPLFINIFGLVLGPAIQRHPRYLFPVIFSMPVMFCYYLKINEE